MTHQSGVSLIEVLICFLLTAIMLLGLNATQMTALRASQSSYYFSVAAQQINNLIELLTVFGEDAAQIERWNKENTDVLPHGRGVIDNQHISIVWGDFSEASCVKNTIRISGCIRTTR